MLGRAIGEPAFAGFVVGYLFYDGTHYYVHHFVPTTRWGKFLRRHHMTHHFADHDGGFGVSSPLWDVVFRTMPSKREVARARLEACALARARRHHDGVDAPAGKGITLRWRRLMTSSTFRKDVFVALAAIAWADGSLDPDEADGIVRAAADEGLSLDDMAAIDEATKHPVDLGVIDRSGMSKEDRLFVFAVACWIARMDGKVTDSESARARQARRAPRRSRANAGPGRGDRASGR